jgi:hypothetical protein
MAKIVDAVGHARPTKHGKREIALAMYRKGNSFIGAAILLRQHGGDEYVVLHLLCQGIEILMKGLLLVVDYDRFKPRLRTKTPRRRAAEPSRRGGIGHNLLAATDEAMKAAGLPAFRGAAHAELKGLNTLYTRHLLRYASTHDVLVDGRTIPHRRLLHRIGALLRRISRRGIPNAKAI